MVKAQSWSNSKSFNAAAGAIICCAGLLLLFANLDDVASRVADSFSSNGSSLGAVIELGLAGMRAVQSYFFDRPAFHAGVHVILVSFWPVIPVILGAVLLQGAFKRRQAAPDKAAAHSEGEIADE